MLFFTFGFVYRNLNFKNNAPTQVQKKSWICKVGEQKASLGFARMIINSSIVVASLNKEAENGHKETEKKVKDKEVTEERNMN